MFGVRSRVPHVLFALHSSVAAWCVVGPGYRWWGASARPFVFGLPWSLVWPLIWLALVFASLLAYERWTRKVEDANERAAQADGARNPASAP